MLIQRAALLDGRVVDIRVGAQITEMAPASPRTPTTGCSTPRVAR